MSIVLGDCLLLLGIKDADAKNALSKFENHTRTWASNLGGVLKGALSTALVTGVAAIGGGLVVAGKEALQFANDTNKAMDSFKFQTGLAGAALGEFKNIAKDIFVSNWGESIQDVADVMAEVRNATGTAGDELERLSTNAIVLRDRFGVDVADSINAAKTLMDQFGLTGDQAFNFIVTGLQRGLNTSGDFLDSISEYSNLFAEGRADAGQFFSILETGLQGGVLGTDKAADAFKEFQIRMLDGSTTTSDALTALGIDTEGFFGKVQSGQITAVEAFDMVIGKIGELNDPLAQNQIGVALLGTQFEDMGARGVTAIDANKTALEDMSGAMQKAMADSSDLGNSWEGVMRKFQVATEPAAQEILPLLNEGMAKLGDFITAAAPTFEQFGKDLKATVGPAMLVIEDAALRIAKALGYADEKTTGLDLGLKLLKTTLDLVVTAIKAVAVSSSLLADAFENARALADQLKIISRHSPGQVAGALGIPGFATGGIVPGPVGAPVLAQVHGGEVISPFRDFIEKLDRIADALANLQQQTDARSFSVVQNNYGPNTSVPLALSTLTAFGR